MPIASDARRPFHQRSLARFSLAFLCSGALWSCDPAAVSPADTDSVAAESALTLVPLARKLRSIDVTPADPLLQVDLNKQGTRAFKVIARYNDRSTSDVTAAAVFTLDNPALGTITNTGAGARFESSTRTTSQVGFSLVTVRYREGGVEATAQTQLTVAWLRQSGPSPDLLYTLPYLGGTESATVGFGTNVQALDAFLAVDTTGSMTPPIVSLRDGLDALVLPAIRGAAPDAWVGVGAVEDFPSGSFGSPSCGGAGVPDDQPFILLSPMSNVAATTKTAVGNLLRGANARGCGADTPEGQMEALYQIATGAGNVVSGVVNIPAHHDKGRGGVEFRAGALPVVAMVTDASFHGLGEPMRTCFGSATDYSGAVAMAAHGRTDTTTALKNLCARVVGVSIQLTTDENCIANKDLTQLATDTGALVPPEAWDGPAGRPMGCAAGQCCTGVGGAGEPANASGLCPLVLKVASSGAGTAGQLAAGISQLARYSPSDVSLTKLGVTTDQDGTALPAGKTTADFLQPFKAVDGVPPTMPAGLKTPVVSGDHFTGVVPGSTVRFTLDAKNDFIPAGPRPQVFKAKVRTLASGCAVLDERDVLVIVPAS